MLTSRPRLLVIDDDVLVRRAYLRVLRHDFLVEEVSGARTALARIALGVTFDVIVCDLNLGEGESGQDFFDSLSPDLQTRVVICTGTEPAADDAFAAALGERFWVKDRSIAVLLPLLRRVARTGGATDAAA
jgi:CheY-like chemotaxis protein